MRYRELQEGLRYVPVDIDAASEASARLEEARSILAQGHNRLIDWRVAALSRAHGGSAEAFAIGARVALAALNAILGVPTPERSGEADKTGTGLAEGESGLPEGSSKP